MVVMMMMMMVVMMVVMVGVRCNADDWCVMMMVMMLKFQKDNKDDEGGW